MLTCTGLITYTSETRSPEGALVTADNVNVDEPNVITPRRGVDDFLDTFVPGDETVRAKQLIEYKDKVIRHFNDKLEYENGTAFVAFDGSYNELEDGLRIKAKEFNGNLYLTTTDGIQKISAISSSEFTSDPSFIIKAGVQKATDLSSSVIATTGGFLPPQSKVAYRGLFGYKDANNTIPYGSPSARLVVTNSAKDINIAEESTIIVTGTTFVNSQYILLYSTTGSYVLWFDVSGSATPPATAETVGKTLVKISLNGYTSTTQIIASKIAQDLLSQITDFDVSVASSTVSIQTKESGSTLDIATGTGFTSNATVATSVQGQIIAANSANVSISAIIPDLVTTNYFFQLYRTSVVEVTEGLTIDDIDPDDEMQLVFETPVTAADIANKEVTVLDVTPELFRAAGTPLYTNPNTGETIAQSNEVPPVAKDIEPFKNCMFYANTRYFHQTTVTVVSVDNFISDSTQFYVGDGSGIQSYTFVGEQEITNLQVAETSRTVGGSYVNLNSASNINKYYMWFDKGEFALSFNSTSDVNDATDTITIAGHGLETNDKVVASGTLPSGLSINTEYYAIRVDANNFKLSLTANGSAINLTDAVGTGILTHISVDPAVTNKIGIRVDLTLYPDTVQGTRDAITDSLIAVSDFSAVQAVTVNIVTLTNSYNGNAEDFTLSTISPGPLWGVTTTQQGDGEAVRGSFSAVSLTNPMQVTAANHGLKTGDPVKLIFDTQTSINGNYTATFINKDTFSVIYDNTLGATDTGKFVENTNAVLLSSLPSVSQAIDETTRSLVKQINLNANSTINAFYLSGAEDLPGNFLLQKKTLEDNSFFLAINDAALSAEFSPEIPVLKTVDTVTFSSGANSPAKITTAAPHGIVNNTNIYISSPDTVPAFAGMYKATVTSTTEFTVPINITTEDLSGSNCFFYIATVKSDNLVKPNRLYYSKFALPEAVPTLNYLDVGNKDKAILRILALRDNLFVMKEDGVFLIFGDSFTGFRERLLDRNTAVSAPDTAVTLNNQIYVLADQGIVAISDSGAQVMSRLVENKFKDVTNPRFDFKFNAFGVSYETDRSYLIWLPTKVADTYATQCYRLNTVEQTWTRWTLPATCGLVKGADDKLYIGAGDRAFVMQERKNADRSDYADRSFTRSISSSGYNTTNLTIVLSSVTDMEVGDVVYQSQTVTVTLYNRLLRKLDLDSGLNDDDYESSLLMSSGENIATKLNSLNTKLFADIGAPIDNARVFTNDFTAMRPLYNDLIDELNNALAITQFKNYAKLDTEIEEYPTPYEAVIVALNKSNNTITINTPSAFIEGNCTVFKGIKCVVQWAPMHYGDPMAYKQISSATCIFDQNNFYNATMAFSSDLSPSFTEVSFFGKGLGDWGSSTFGDLDLYWGGNGNDVPYRDIVPIDKQRCRYHNIKFSHVNAREFFRILGISASVRAYSDRAYRGIKN